MFQTIIDKNTFDAIMTAFFQNLGIVDTKAFLEVTSLHFDDTESQTLVVIEADVYEETMQ